MTELYKERNFGDLITDTFGFIKSNGKHYFKNYFTINGAFLLVTAILMYFFSKIYTDFVFMSLQNPMMQSSFMDNYVSWIWAGILGFLLLMFVTILHHAFPVIYFRNYEINGTNFGSSELFASLKSHLGKIITFFFLSFFAVVLPAIIVFTLLVVLSVFIIGIPLLIIAIPTFFSFVQQSLFHFLNTDDTFFTSLGEGWNAVFKKFWPVIGSTAIIHVIIQVVMGLFTMIIYIVGAIFVYLDIEQNNSSEAMFSIISVFISVLFIISTLASLILNNLLFINQSMIYYSHRDSIEKKSSFTSINSIGQNLD